MENKRENQENCRPREENDGSYSHLRVNGSKDSLKSGSDPRIENSLHLNGKSGVSPHGKIDNSNVCINGRDLSSLGGIFNVPRRPRGYLKRTNPSFVTKELLTPIASISGKREHRYGEKGNGCDLSEFSLLKVYKKAKRSIRTRPNPKNGRIKSFDMSNGDEKILEENAAQMLSSRFNPRCTEESSNLGCGPPSSSSSSSLNPSVHKRKGSGKKRRRFYEVRGEALDPYWVLKRRIRVFLPVDQAWYSGYVKDYNPTTMMHHVKYDDHDDEWINLRGKRFKLLLLPNELTSKLVIKEEDHDGSESEPIISWMARSSKRFKASNLIKWSNAVKHDETNCHDDTKFTCVYYRRRKKIQKDRIFDHEPSAIPLKRINTIWKFFCFSPSIQPSVHTWIAKEFFMHHHFKLQPLWPLLSLEILLLDDSRGLMFLSLNGDLLHAVRVLTLFIRVFHGIERFVDLTSTALPLTSFGVKLSCIQGGGRRLFFYLYKFFRTPKSQWFYVERQLEQLSVKLSVLPLSEISNADLQIFLAEKIRHFDQKGMGNLLKREGHPNNHPLSLSTTPGSTLFSLHFNSLTKKKASSVSLTTVDSVDTNPRIHHGKRQHHKRKRLNSMKETSVDFPSKVKKSVDFFSCEANVLVTAEDRGWRERKAQIVIDPARQKDRIIIVKVSGENRYFYKPHQPLQQGATNRYTHAMLWKGGKDWTLEFPDRKEWSIFKEMYQECCDFNLRAASLKHIPIPGVSLVEGYEASANETLPFVQSASYMRQKGTEVDFALDRSRVVYDLDSEDEEWVSKSGKMIGVSEEMMEKMIDVMEKEAFLQRRIEFERPEIEGMMDGFVPDELVGVVYEYWLRKRQRNGISLIREFQPPLWERYQSQLAEWESEKSKSKMLLDEVSVIDKPKPPAFAFCMRPRGLELLGKSAKQRSHKKVPFLQGRRMSRSLSREKSVNGVCMFRQTEEMMARDAVNAARDLSNIAKFKREKARWMMYRADVAIHRAVSVLMTVEAMKLGEEDDSETESSDLIGMHDSASSDEDTEIEVDSGSI